MRGLRTPTTSYRIPKRSATPGLNDSASTSAVSLSGSSLALSVWSFRLRTMLFLPQFRLRKNTVLGPSERPM